jgi:hypothetical protein
VARPEMPRATTSLGGPLTRIFVCVNGIEKEYFRVASAPRFGLEFLHFCLKLRVGYLPGWTGA